MTQTAMPSATQALSASYADVNIFIPSVSPTLVPMASSIGYPAVTTTASPSTIVLEAGWKYLIEFRVKVTDTTALIGENVQYIATDTSNNQISSTGSNFNYFVNWDNPAAGSISVPINQAGVYTVKVIGIDDRGRIDLSRKDTLPKPKKVERKPVPKTGGPQTPVAPKGNETK